MENTVILVGNFTTLELEVSGEVDESTKNHTKKWYVGTGRLFGGGKMIDIKSKDVLDFRFKTQDSDKFIYPSLAELPSLEKMLFADVLIGGQQIYKLFDPATQDSGEGMIIDNLTSMIIEEIGNKTIINRLNNMSMPGNPMIEIPVFNLSNKAYGDFMPPPKYASIA